LLGVFLPECADVGKVRSSRITFTTQIEDNVLSGDQGQRAEPARRCYNKAHDLEHGFHTPALPGES
jgi:hypothetical protein